MENIKKKVYDYTTHIILADGDSTAVPEELTSKEKTIFNGSEENPALLAFIAANSKEKNILIITENEATKSALNTLNIMFSEEAHISILFNGELFAKEVIEEIKVLESYLFDADGNRHVITEQISLASFYADENGNIMIKDIKCDGNDHLALRNYKNEHWGEIVPGINASEYIGTAATAPENLDTTYEKICLANDIIKAAGDDKLPPIEDILVFKREDGSFVTLFDYSDIGESKPLSCFDIVYTVLCGHAPTADEDIAATIIEDVTSLNLPSYFLNDLMVEYGHVFFKGNNVQNLSNDRLLNTVERLVIESKTFN